MPVNNVPSLGAAGGYNVSTGRTGANDAGFGATVVEEVVPGGGYTTTQINNMIVVKQAPAAGKELTAGEVMHLYVQGTGGTVTPDPGTERECKRLRVIVIVQFVVIVVLVGWCFVFGG